MKSNGVVPGIWVKTDNDSSGFADWRKTNTSGSEVTFAYVLNGDAYNLHVGCGGSKQRWNNIYTTETGFGTIQDQKAHFLLVMTYLLQLDIDLVSLTIENRM